MKIIGPVCRRRRPVRRSQQDQFLCEPPQSRPTAAGYGRNPVHTQDELRPVEGLIVEDSSELFTYEDRLEYLLYVAGTEVVTFEQLWWCAEEVIGCNSPVEAIQEKMLQFVSDMLEKGVLVGGLEREQDGENVSLSTHSRAQVVAEIRKQVTSKNEWKAMLQMGWLAFEESPLWP
ncbi:hypothetical protein ACWEO8_13000 [Streptomyces albidoflavus]